MVCVIILCGSTSLYAPKRGKGRQTTVSHVKRCRWAGRSAVHSEILFSIGSPSLETFSLAMGSSEDFYRQQRVTLDNSSKGDALYALIKKEIFLEELATLIIDYIEPEKSILSFMRDLNKTETGRSLQSSTQEMDVCEIL